jgi:predicted metalloenzyme YecM
MKNIVKTSNPENTTASDFLSNLHEQVPSFVTAIVAEVKSQYDIDVTDLHADHVCYRTETIAQYTALVGALQSVEASDSFTLLVESVIGGRQIATFKLARPIEIGLGNCRHSSIDVVEIPSPKEGSPYDKGLEHIEFVIGDAGTHKSPMNDEVHATALDAWMRKYPSISWNTKALHKQCNPDLSLKLELPDYGRVSVKFHLIPLETVIKFETGAV